MEKSELCLFKWQIEFKNS